VEAVGRPTAYYWLLKGGNPWQRLRNDHSQKMGGVEDNPSQEMGGVEGPPLPIFADDPSQKMRETPPKKWEGKSPLENPSIKSPMGDISPPLPPADDFPAIEAASEADPPPLAKSLPDGFEAFWSAYPRREGRRAAERAYSAALNRGADPSDVLRGAMRYAAERDRERDAVQRHRFTAMPATWLNADRWDDHPPPVPSGSFGSFGLDARGPRAAPRRESALEKAGFDMDAMFGEGWR
jgi:hypothetical protein